MLHTLYQAIMYTAPLWIILGAMLMAVIAVDGWR
jgi:hypothetical protein